MRYSKIVQEDAKTDRFSTSIHPKIVVSSLQVGVSVIQMGGSGVLPPTVPLKSLHLPARGCGIVSRE